MTDGIEQDVADGVERRPAASVVTLWRLESAIAALPMIGLSLVPALWIGRSLERLWVGGLLWILFSVIWMTRALVWPALRYRVARYRLIPEGLEIRRGVLWRVEIFVPRSRIQHTDVRVGPLERGFGLATLVVYTAGTAHASVHFDGLPYERANAIRNRLMPDDSADAV
jgi:membrane protein YdbS with pleckstrin-like domain